MSRKEFNNTKSEKKMRWYQFLFSLRNEGPEKVLIIFGIKISVKRRIIQNILHPLIFFQDLNSISAIRKSRNNILIIEPNMKYHAECLPSYVKYFNDLGYTPDLVLSRSNYNLNPFCRCNNLKMNIFPINEYNCMENIVSNKKIIKKYKKIMITTSIALNGVIVPELIKDKKQIIPIVHSIATLDTCGVKYATNGKCFLLSYFDNNNYPTINPHYFGKIQNTSKNKKITRFISVGRIQSDVKNYDILTDSVKRLLTAGYKDFEVVLVGWSGELELEPELSKYIIQKGKLSFEDMFNELEKSDFYLSLLDYNNTKHLYYTNDLATGSNQLVLAFKKPYLISEIYAKAYGYDNNSAIVYQKNALSDAMIKAINIKDDEYSNLQHNIDILADNLYKLSLKNLREELND